MKSKPGKNKWAGKEVISVDIGENRTKVVVGKQERNGVRLSQAFSFTTPRYAYEKGQIIGFEELKKALQEQLSERKVKAKAAFASVESADIITREIAVPQAKPEELEKLLQFEIQQYMPIELSQYVVQYKAIEEFEEEGVNKVRVLVTAMPRELARTYYELLESCGLDAAVLDIQSNAVDKLFCCDQKVNGGNGFRSQSVAVLDLGHRHINVVVLENGQFKFNRFLNHGAWDINVNISHGTGIEPEETEVLKLNIPTLRKGGLFDDRGVAPEERDATKEQALELTRRTVDGWVEDIERVIKYYTTRSTGNVLERIYVYGGVVEMNGFPEYLQESLNIPVEKIESLSGVNFGKAGEGPITDYINAFGTLMRR